MNNIKNGISKFESYLPIYGFRKTLKEVLRNIFLIEFAYRFEKDLGQPEDKYEPKIPLDIIPICETNGLKDYEILDSIKKIRGDYGLDQATQRLEVGYVMFCAISMQKLAGFIWLNPFPVKGAGYKLQSNQAYHIDGWTFEPFRGVGVLPTLQQGVFNYLRKYHPEIDTLIGHASAWNKPSIIGQQKAGLKITAKELSIVYFGLHNKIKIQNVS